MTPLSISTNQWSSRSDLLSLARSSTNGHLCFGWMVTTSSLVSHLGFGWTVALLAPLTLPWLTIISSLFITGTKKVKPQSSLCHFVAINNLHLFIQLNSKCLQTSLHSILAPYFRLINLPTLKYRMEWLHIMSTTNEGLSIKNVLLLILVSSFVAVLTI